MLTFLLLLALAYYSYTTNQRVNKDAFRAWWTSQQRRAAEQAGDKLTSFMHKVAPASVLTRAVVPPFDCRDCVLFTLVTIRDNGDLYLGWLGTWFPVATGGQVASVVGAASNGGASGSAARSEEADRIEAKAQAEMDSANDAKKKGDYVTAARHFTAAASHFSMLASADVGSALDASRAYEQAASAYAHPSLADHAARLAALDSALQTLARAPAPASTSTSSSIASRQLRLREQQADAQTKAGNLSGALDSLKHVILATSEKAAVGTRANYAGLLAQVGKYADARQEYRHLLQECSAAEYQFRAGEFALGMIASGLADGYYSRVKFGVQDADEVNASAWAGSRERSFLQTLARDVLHEDEQGTVDGAKVVRHLESWKAMLDGWRLGVLQTWIQSTYPDIEFASSVAKESGGLKKRWFS
ncbi:hypothetical protein BCR44DRAFT_80422 [Catenaria anguillulae PL171]|uniref:Soluble NSF attachment protein n=1 Tax=Catenaria anguillulae PL171 TaxID=765915 RepID=A0A1Y2HUG3_9FUNG|nr:hypothetical protein BCR44DRAFT_80422 [Catenaria anguillulae PL171]